MLLSYLGGKTEILPEIISTVKAVCPPGGQVVDLFSGSTAVSLEAKKNGYRVICNDTNKLSQLYGQAYLVPSKLPDLDHKLIPSKTRSNHTDQARAEVDNLAGQDGWTSIKDNSTTYKNLINFRSTLNHLETLTPDDLPVFDRKSLFTDAFSPQGANSRFADRKGIEGRRAYWTTGNAVRLDLMLNQLRSWYQTGAVSHSALSLLTATVLTGADRRANTMGTYGAWERRGWKNRALVPISLRTPPIDGLLDASHPGGNQVLRSDAIELAAQLPPTNVAYLDPPYCFRQYSAYYHLANLVAHYPWLDDPKDWFDKLELMRGQNLTRDNYQSPLCSKTKFLPALEQIVADLQADHLILSYYSGPGHLSNDPDKGLGRLTRVLERHCRGGVNAIEVQRRNYGSHSGKGRQKVSEWLLVGNKKGRQD